VDVAELVFHQKGKDLLRWRVDRAETCIGSNPTNDLVIPDSTLPDVAAVLIDRGAMRFKLRDLTNGRIRINRGAIDADEQELADGDVIELGSFALKFRIRTTNEPSIRHTQILGGESAEASGGAAILVSAGQTHRLAPDRPFNVGSDEDNDLQIEDEFVSSFHCRIVFQNGRWILVDLGSTNGTLVNGLRVREAELPIPASIQIGRATMSFQIEAPSGGAEIGESILYGGMLARGPKMKRLFTMIAKFADKPAPVLITGESGSGKELIARALHDESSRSGGPFIAINCGALAANLIESELFGHMKGSFTGAAADKKGAFEAAQGGTLFLDEIGELPLELQPKLLRALESMTIRRVGGTAELPFDARIIAATHRNLNELVEQGLFREDLFHRLYVLNIAIPSLRERPEDIVPIAKHFIENQSSPAATGGRIIRLTAEAEEAMVGYTWPGNVRELRNVILRAILMCEGDSIGASDLQFSETAFASPGFDARSRLRRADDEERKRIVDALIQTNDNRAEAARILGMSKSTFHDKLKRLGLGLKGIARPKR
jgi:DNA-binding NtrC family response regulator/pSer/pThr/pTyr-binding forkhead associated (FHA) protein